MKKLAISYFLDFLYQLLLIKISGLRVKTYRSQKVETVIRDLKIGVFFSPQTSRSHVTSACGKFCRLRSTFQREEVLPEVSHLLQVFFAIITVKIQIKCLKRIS